jgi:hypothetical protein
MKELRAGIVLASLALGLAESAGAVGTASGTSVDNLATIQYAVGATTQPVIESSPTGNTVAGVGAGTATSFLVDNRIDLTVVELSGSYSVVAPGGVNEVLVYTVANTGNTPQDFLLTALDNPTDPFGGTDNFDATPVGIFVDANDDGLYDAGDTATYIDELAADDDVEVFVVRSIPGGQPNGDISAVTLTAQVAQGGAATAQGAAIAADDAGDADDPALVQIVFAEGAGDTDAANDGQHSDTDAYRVGAAVLTVAKSSLVVSDPVNGGTNPKAIPGAIVEYTITIGNDVTATASATSVQVTDDLAPQISAGNILFNANGYGAGQGMQVTAPNINAGAPTPLSNVVDVDTGDFAGNLVTVGGITLNAGESATVRFQVEIQ